MCIFSAAASVANTSILVGRLASMPNRARVVYCNDVAAAKGTVMVLPVPTSYPDSINLFELPKTYWNVGERLTDWNYYLKTKYGAVAKSSHVTKSVAKPAPIIQYGPYDVSITDRLSIVQWDHYGGLSDKTAFYDLMQSRYSAWSYVVAKLRSQPTQKSSRRNAEPLMPIVYDFPMSAKSKVTLPMFHVHDGKASAVAEWDHIIAVLDGTLSLGVSSVSSHDYGFDCQSTDDATDFPESITNLLLACGFAVPTTRAGLTSIWSTTLPNQDGDVWFDT